MKKSFFPLSTWSEDSKNVQLLSSPIWSHLARSPRTPGLSCTSVFLRILPNTSEHFFGEHLHATASAKYTLIRQVQSSYEILPLTLFFSDLF